MSNTQQPKASWKTRIGTWGVGYVANFLLVWVFDYALYPYVMWQLGLIKGAAVMWVLSFINCYATMRFYDWAKVDWLGLETLKEVKEAEDKGGLFRKIMRWALSKGDIFVFFVLSIKFDPFICVVYMRKGAHEYNGLSKRDWAIFLSSFVLANLYWTIAVLTGIEMYEWFRGLPVEVLLVLLVFVTLVILTYYVVKGVWTLTTTFSHHVVRGVRAFAAAFSQAPRAVKVRFVIQVLLWIAFGILMQHLHPIATLF